MQDTPYGLCHCGCGRPTHLCRVKACVNPGHLEPVTDAQNLRRGAGTKLNEAQVRDIYRRAHGGEMLVSLALAFGVTPTQIRAIKRGKRWADVTGHADN